MCTRGCGTVKVSVVPWELEGERRAGGLTSRGVRSGRASNIILAVKQCREPRVQTMLGGSAGEGHHHISFGEVIARKRGVYAK